MFLETNKHVYYPGDTIEGSIHLRVNSKITSVGRLVLQVKGTESFKFKSIKKNQRSLKNEREIINDRVVLCQFAPSYLDPSDYTFLFSYKIPENLTN